MSKLEEKLEAIDEKNKDIVELCNKERVFYVTTSRSGLVMVEACDEWYTIPLDRDTCIKLAKYFSDLLITYTSF